MNLIPKLKIWLSLLLIGLVLLAPEADARRRKRRRTRRGAARSYFTKAKQMFEAKDYVGALAAFERAYRLRPHFLVQCNIARCYERLSKLTEAVTHYRRCLAQGADRSKTAERVRAALEQVEARITWVDVVSPGAGGTVYVDGREVGPAPKRVALNPGTAVIEVRRQGAEAARTTITARGGTGQKVELVPKDLRPLVHPRPPPAPEPLVATARIEQKQGADESRRGLHQLWFWTSTTVTVGLAVVATVLGVQALGLKSDYEENPTREGYNAAKDKRLLANIFWGTTVAAAGTSTLIFFYTDFGGRGKGAAPDEDDEEEVSFVVGVQGTF